MSIINQMLRDLDARSSGSPDLPSANHSVPRNKRSPVWLLGFVLLSVSGVAAYITLSGQEDGAIAISQPLAEKRQPVSPAVATLPPISAGTQPGSETHVVAPVVVAPTPEAPRPADALKGQISRSLVMPNLVGQDAPVSLPSAQAEPEVVKKAVELTPEAEAQQHYEEAQLLRRLRKTDQAIAKYRQALERHPGMRDARLQWAGLLRENGQGSAAVSLLKAGYEQQPDSGLAIAAGRFLADQGKRDEALDWLERGRDGLRPSDHALMGALLSQSQRHEEAVKEYQRALMVEPHQGGWLLGLGLALESAGQLEEAKVAYRNALEHGEFKAEVTKFLRQKTGVVGQ